MPITDDHLAKARHAISNLRARLDRTRSGKRGTARVELHVDVAELELVVQLAEQAERRYTREGY